MQIAKSKEIKKKPPPCNRWELYRKEKTNITPHDVFKIIDFEVWVLWEVVSKLYYTILQKISYEFPLAIAIIAVLIISPKWIKFILEQL